MKARGFTLIEMLVALAILAIALAATYRAMSGAVDNAGELRLRLLADWVAENRLAAVRAEKRLPAVGEQSGTEEQAGITFHWRQQVSQTLNPHFRRIEIRVTRGADAAHAEALLVGYLTGLDDAR